MLQLLRFRQRLQDRGVLVWSYQDVADFEAKVRQHLTQAVRHRAGRARPTAQPSTVAFGYSDEAGPGDPQRWHQQAAAGALHTAVEARTSGELYALVAAVTAALPAHGFHKSTVDRVAVGMVELLTNVARHADTPAWVDVTVQRSYFPSVRVAVADRGPGFDLDRVLGEQFEQLAAGGYEHGLIRTLRLTNELRYVPRSSADDRQGVVCEVHQLSPRRSVLLGRPAVAPVLISYGIPLVVWLGEQPYTGSGLAPLEFAYQRPARSVLDLYFGPLRAAARDGWLVVEFDGDRVSSVRVLKRASPREPPGLPPLFGPLTGALEESFPAHFADGRVLVAVSGDLSDEVGAAVEQWARAHDLETCWGAARVATRLDELGPTSPA